MNKLYCSAILVIILIGFLTPKYGFSQVDLEIPSTTVAPVIDGVIDAVWANDAPKPLQKILAGSATSASDFSAYFKILWDASALYVLVDVTDDVKINDSDGFWEDDAFELYFDIGNDKQTSYGSNDYQSVFGWNDPAIVTGPSNGVVFKIVGTATGYLLEVKYPWSTLGLTSPHDGVLLGLDVHVHDDDDGVGRDNKLAWFTTVDLSYQNPSLFGTASLKNSTPVIIDMQIPSTEIAPIIDGTIDEVWSADNSKSLLKILGGGSTTSTDLSASFKAVWDASGLYVLTVVSDETKINDSGGETWKDDGIEVYIDIDNNKPTTYGANDYQFTFRWNDLSIYANNGTTAGIEFKISDTPTGYIFEAKFPWTTLGLSSPRSGILLGYDVHVNDDDNGGERDHKIAWFTTTDNSWNNPSLFANAKLIGDVALIYPADKPQISVERGFYENPFDVSISSALPGMSIYYTLDGSDPATSSTATVTTSPAVVRIDPESSVNRGKTPGVVLRARAKKSGYDFSAPVTRTYMFIKKMAIQANFPGHNWPSGNSINGQEIDLLMDTRVLNDNRYKNLIDDAFLEIPSISISTDQENLFGPASGIYVNAWDGRGIDWERPASVELINPNGSDGFQIDAGIRIRGGWSRNGYFRKHAFRLFFRNEYGEGKLDFPLFGAEGVDEFDKMDLRCPQNYSWSKGDGYEAQYCTFTRDVFSRDLQREMNQPYTRSRYYHLFINGLYWGLFQTQERSEAKYAESYFGGDADDYDVIKRVGNVGAIEATDGTTDSWRAVWDICQQGFDGNTNYYKLQGLDATGKRNPSLKVMVDIDNLIDYMNVIFYTGNFDAPVSIWGNNKNPNNLYAIYNRNDDKGFQFFAHDNEHTLLVDPINSSGLYENRVNIGSINSDMQMIVWNFEQFQPQWLHYKLSENAEYRMRFADRANKYYSNNGILTPAKTAELFRRRTLEIDTAIIAESARWGDVGVSNPYTKDDAWLPIVNRTLNEYFPARSNIVINQLKDEGLLPNVVAPQFKQNNVEVLQDQLQLSPGNALSIVYSGATGSIKYTIDGTDPRLTGGNVAPTAVDGAKQANISILQTCIVKARVFSNGNWSALRTLNVFVNTAISGLQITEIHYNPLSNEGMSGGEYEFVELKNSGSAPINLTSSTFIDGIKFTFTNQTIINPGTFVVLASSAYSFKQLYGFSPFGEFDGQLDNKGERITLVNPVGDTIITVKYGDKAPWPTTPDSLGFSLVPAVSGMAADWDDGNNWRASSKIGGSPNADDGFIEIPAILINEILSNSETPQVDAIELYNPTNSAVNVSGWYLSDNRSMPKKWKIPSNTTIPANGYLLIKEGHYVNTSLQFTANEFGSAFSLSSHGEEVFVFSANATGDLTGYEHGFDFGEIETGVTFGRHINSIGKEHFVAQASSTLNSQNGNPRVGPIVINQLMYNPQSDQYEFLELINTSSGDVKLFDEANGTPWKVDGIGFDFPSNVTLRSGESVFLVESAINAADYKAFFNLESSAKVYNFSGGLKNEGEEITLFKAAPQYIETNVVKTPYIRIDKVDYNDNEVWADADGNGYALQRISLAAYGNDPASWVATPPGIKIKTLDLPDAIELVAYSKELLASGGTTPYSWSTTSGNLPSGVSLNPVTGLISGTPTQKGVFTVTVKVEDMSGGSNAATLTLEVKENTLPVAVNDTVTTLTNFSIIADILDNDTDLDGDKSSWSLSVSNAPLHGTALVNSDKTITYFPERSFVGTDRLTYRITDAKGSSSAQLIIYVQEEVVTLTLESRISLGSDDAEENINSHQFWDGSSDIELVYDPSPGGDQVVGLRFLNIELPVGATVTNAYIQFKTDEITNSATNLTIHGVSNANPGTFTFDNLISSRSVTASSVNWQPESWNIEGEVSARQQSTNLSEIVTEIIELGGWASGNAMAFIVSGTGSRVAEAFEGDAAGAPLLHIEYKTIGDIAVVPVANAGGNQNVTRGSSVQLNGSLSTSADGRSLNYHWVIKTKPSGSAAVISNQFIVNPTFTADKFGTYEITLMVDNGVNDSELSTTIITVENRQPIANAGSDQTHTSGSFIRLNGSGSNDPDGDPLTYLWRFTAKPAGSATTLSNATIVNPTFTADIAGIYSLNLTVSDGLLTSVTDVISITITSNQPPVAKAGADQNIITGTLVNLDGTKSSDPEEDALSYNWTVVSKPAGSSAAISSSSASKPTIQPDRAGSYVIRLVVSDGVNSSVPDELTIVAVDNQPPVAIAGDDQTINAGQQVTLDGSDSHDPEGGAITYQWSIVTKPAGSGATLVNSSSSKPTFTPDVSGLYAFKMRVSDGTYTSEDQVQVTALRTNDVISYSIYESLKVYPNPFTDKLVVDYFSPEHQKVEFTLCTVSGSVIKKFIIDSNGNCSKILDFENVRINRGMYLLIMKPEAGEPRSIKVTRN